MSTTTETTPYTFRRWLNRWESSQWIRWAIVFALVLVAVAVITSLDRFTEWDEAVFYSQSGGYKGTRPPPMPLVASREGGPGFLIALVRLLGVGLVGVRLVWVLLSLLVAAVAYHRLGRRYAPLTPEIAFLGFGLSWLGLAYLGSLYGSLFAGLFLLLAAALLLDLVDAKPRSLSSYRIGAFLGLAVALAFWMRQAESLIGAVVITLFSVAIHRAVIWRRQIRAVLVAGGTFILGFVVPWIVWSVREFGSISGRMEALQGQMDGRSQLEITNGLGAYLDAMSGTLRTYGMFALVPNWPRQVIVVSLVLVVVALAVTISRDHLESTSLWGIGLLVAITVVLFSLFAFYYASVEIRERYLTTVLPFVAGLGGIGIAGLLRIQTVSWARVVKVGLVVGIAAIWLTAQVAIAVPFQRARVADAEGILLTSDAIRVASEGEACIGASRYGRPQLQLGTGCWVRGVYSRDAALALAIEFEGRGSPAFLLWPETLDLGSEWITVDRSSPAGSEVLHLLSGDE